MWDLSLLAKVLTVKVGNFGNGMGGHDHEKSYCGGSKIIGVNDCVKTKWKEINNIFEILKYV